MVSTAEPEARSHGAVMAALGGLLVTLLLAALDGTIVATALPTIVGELGGLAHLSWVVTAYLLAQTVVTPLYGKLGDLYGRKRILQAAVLIFLAGSALCGLSRSMAQLIVFRAVQGLGGGGLMVTAQAVVGDLVPPRDRGRYQGLFGAAFGVASIAGPLLGGYLTTHMTWRWIFYVNLPVGGVALAVLRATLPAQAARVAHAVDYAGAALLAVALSGVILVTDLGGPAHPWTSATILGLMVLTAAALGAFVLAERRAREPVLPLRLFANRAFAVAAIAGGCVGFALFGAVTYVPLFLQVVKGSSPTASGMQMAPMMGGMLLTSIASGQVISRTGRYKVFPVVGTAVITLGLFLFSRVTAATSVHAAMAILLVVGLGLGLVMQVLVIAVQNAVDYADLGVATSGATLFRLVGGSVGTAALGAVLAVRLAAELGARLPEGAPRFDLTGGLTPAALAGFDPAVRAAYAAAFTASLHTLFALAAVVAALGFVTAWLLPERPLRRSIAVATEDDIGGDVGAAFAMPTGADSVPQILRALRVLADRDVRQRYLEQIVASAGVALPALAARLLLRFDEHPTRDLAAAGREAGLAPDELGTAIAALRERGLVEERGPGDWSITHAGCATLRRLVDARRASLSELFADWPAEKRAEFAEVLARLARQLVPDTRATGA